MQIGHWLVKLILANRNKMVNAHFDVFHRTRLLDLADLLEHLVQLMGGYRLQQIADQVCHTRVLRLHFGGRRCFVKTWRRKKEKKDEKPSTTTRTALRCLNETADHDIQTNFFCHAPRPKPLISKLMLKPGKWPIFLIKEPIVYILIIDNNHYNHGIIYFKVY